jgi:hypothetical protein
MFIVFVGSTGFRLNLVLEPVSLSCFFRFRMKWVLRLLQLPGFCRLWLKIAVVS